MYTKIEGYPDLVKDGNTGAVLSNNNSAYNAVRKRHKSKQLEKDKMQKQETDINSMREELIEIKTMMKTLMEKL
jgi:hypothetical protein